jgi:uncharacterized protein (TIGR02588 family)
MSKPKADTPVLEWIAAALGAALLAAVFGFTLYGALTESGTAAALSFETLSIEPSGGRYLVRFRVTNSGDATATGLNIRGTVAPSGGQTESAEVTFRYVPGRSEREGALIFTQDPASSPILYQPLGYELP